MRKQSLECCTEANKDRLLGTVVRRGPILDFPSKVLVFIIPSTPCPQDKALLYEFRCQITGCMALSGGCLTYYLSGPKVIPDSTTVPFLCTELLTIFFSLEGSSCKPLWEPTLSGSRIATSHPATD